MSGLVYVGALPDATTSVTNKLALVNQIAAAPMSLGVVSSELTALTTGGSATYATKSYVDTQDALYQSVAYYQGRDALNVPTSALNAANGVAGLSAGSKVATAQIPNVGAGYLKGFYGATSVVTSGSTGSTPIRVADWNLGVANVQFRPWAYCQAFLLSTLGQPVLELTIANSTTAPAYGSMTMIAQGSGRSHYADYQAVTAVTAPNATGQSPSLLGTSYAVWITAWIYDLNGSSATSVASGGIAGSAVGLLRGTL